MVIVIIFFKLLVLKLSSASSGISDFHRPIWDKHSRKSTIFLCVTKIFRLKIAQFRNDCAQK